MSAYDKPTLSVGVLTETHARFRRGTPLPGLGTASPSFALPFGESPSGGRERTARRLLECVDEAERGRDQIVTELFVVLLVQGKLVQ